MHTEHTRLTAAAVALCALALISCAEGPGAPQEDAPPVPAPAIEYTRPLVPSDRTFQTVLDSPDRAMDARVTMAESLLTALAVAGAPIREAWVTGRGADEAVVTVRLDDDYPDIAGFGFAAPEPQWSLYDETRHYVFRRRAPVPLPARVMEVNGPPGVYTEQAGENLYRRTWSPDGLRYPQTWILPDDWLAGPEAYLRALVEAGVGVTNAWVTAHHVTCDLEWRVLVVEVAAPDPLLERSGFVEGGMRGGPCFPYRWNYCFEDCPPQRVPLPEPEEMWVSPQQWLESAPDVAPYYHFRPVPSDGYAAALGSVEQAEAHLQEMLRGGVDIVRAWFPVNPAAGEATHVVVETRNRDGRLWWWGYDEEPVRDWAFVRFFDLETAEGTGAAGRHTDPGIASDGR